MERLKNFFRKLVDSVGSVILRFPGVFAFTLVCYVFHPLRGMVLYKDIFPLGLYGMVMSFILEIVLENLKQKGNRFRLICYGTMVLLLSVMLCTKFFDLGKFNFGYVFGMLALIALAIAVFANKERGSFEKNCVVLLVGLIKALVLSGSIAIGLEFIIAGLDFLVLGIGLNIVYKEVFVICGIFLNSFIFLSEVPKIGDDLECPKFLKDMMRFVFVPVAVGWAVVANAAVIKRVVVLKENLEVWWLFYIVIVITFAAIVSVFAKIIENRLVDVVRKVLAVIIIPLLVVAGYIIFKSFVDDGVLFGVYLSLVACIVVLTFIIGILFRDSRYQYVGFLVLAVLCVVGGVGPLSSGKLIERSQQRRMTKIFNKYNMIKDNKIVDSDSISDDDVDKIRQSERWLDFWKLNKPDYYGSEGWIHYSGESNDEDIKVVQEEECELEEQIVGQGA